MGATGNAQGAAEYEVVKEPQPGFIEAEGCEGGLYTFEGFPESIDVSSAKSLRIRNLVINADELTHSLERWTNLESIVIENVWVNGNFTRVYLPKLKKFIFHQYRNGRTDQYKQEDVLKQILFFDLSQTGTWDLNKDLLNLNITVQVTVEGTKILDIEPTRREININTHECQELLQNFQAEKTGYQIASLSLSWCKLGAPFLEKIEEQSSTLEYLFLNNAVPGTTEELAKVTSSLASLKELHLFQRFHCDWPGYEIFLNVSSLPPSIETISVTNLDISYIPGFGAPTVANLSLDRYVGKDVVDNFETIFPNLETVALFNVTQNLSYALLDKVVSLVKPRLVIVTDLRRENMPKSRKVGINADRQPSDTLAEKSVADDVITRVENFLSDSGLPKTANNFVLELCKEKNNTYVGQELTSFQRNFHRFIRLAFKKIDTYTDYIIWDADPK